MEGASGRLHHGLQSGIPFHSIEDFLMLRRHSPMSLGPIARRAPALMTITCGAVLSGCVSPFDLDPRFERIGQQLTQSGSMVAAARAAEVFEPGAPLVGGAALGSRRAAVALRAVAASGRRPDLSTLAANPTGASPDLGSTTASSQTIVIDGAVRLLPGFSVGSERYSVLAVDGLARAAVVATTAPGDASGSLAMGFGGRLGLVSDREGNNGLSFSVMSGSLPGASYEATIAPVAPSTAASASMRVDKITANAVRLQGSLRRGAWGITAGVGANDGNYVLDRRVRLQYADSISMVEEENPSSWDSSVWNVGLTRRVRQADVIVQYGEIGGPSDASMLRHDAGTRRSLSLGVQFVR
jgi:hypothetical protein